MRLAGGALLERADEINRLRRLVEDASAGRGSCLVVVGPPGIGKTALVDTAVADARARGWRVSRAVGGMLERDHPFGLARELLTPLVLDRPDRDGRSLFTGAAAGAAPLLGLPLDGGPASVHDPGLALHALYWLVVNLAEQGPLLLVADDAHWLDNPSLRLLAYLSRRLEGLAVAVLASARPPVPGPDGETLASLLADPAVVLVEPRPLSPPAVAALVRERLGRDPAPAFRDACVQAAGGNPFLTLELLHALHDEHIAPTAAAAATVSTVGRLRAGRAIMGRLQGMPAAALELAQAVSILGSDATMGLVRDLADLDLDTATTAADTLTGLGILVAGNPMTFAHPLVAAAVYESMPPNLRAVRHGRAARLVHAGTAAVERPTAHLLASQPTGDQWAAELLLAAGKQALRRGATEMASRLLRRSLAEPPPQQRTVDVLTALGAAERAMNDPLAVDHLRRAFALATDEHQRFEIAGALRGALVGLGRHAEAVAFLREVLAATTAPVLKLRLEAALAQTGLTDTVAAGLARREIDRLAARANLEADLPLDVEAVATFLAAVTNTGRSVELGRRAAAVLHRLRSTDPDELPLWCSFASWATVVCEHPDVEALNTWLVAEGRRRGDSLLMLASLQNLAWARLRQGKLAEAEADARTALEVSQLHRATTIVPESVAVLVHVLLERNRVADAANALVEHGFGGDLDGRSFTYAFLLHARARLRMAQDELDDAIADLRSAGASCRATHAISPAHIPWRSDLAAALHASGRTSEAVAVAGQEVDLARSFEAPGALGRALRVLASIAGDEGMLAESVAVLEAANSPLELAHTLIALGRLVRRHSRARARELLRRGLDLANRCGSAALAERARAELGLAGARPRRTAVSGPASLTAAELRTAILAASDHTNKDIAQATFVTLKTVETQLAAAYRKLGITRRHELAAALADRSGA